MPKIKTNRAAAKRFRVTGSGKVKRNKGFKSHICRAKEKSERESCVREPWCRRRKQKTSES